MAKEDVLFAPVIRWMREPIYDQDGVQVTSGVDQFGREHPDPVPMRPPVGLSVSQGDELHSQLKKLLQRERAEFMRMVQAEEFETEDEANDFLTEDELLPPGSEEWEDVFDLPEVPLTGNGEVPAKLASGGLQSSTEGVKNPTAHSPVSSGGNQGDVVSKRTDDQGKPGIEVDSGSKA